jgi:hypothetical protein
VHSFHKMNVQHGDRMTHLRNKFTTFDEIGTYCSSELILIWLYLRCTTSSIHEVKNELIIFLICDLYRKYEY